MTGGGRTCLVRDPWQAVGMERGGAVYIMTSRNRRVLYTGVTADLAKRVFTHRSALDPRAFTARYGVQTLVYFELHGDIREAIQREKKIKGWTRRKKINLIESINPQWNDLWDEVAS
jgi:putative endonuclease